ncbi:MAG: adenosylmethionine--8-amino-7-oxononanoate transaminase [Humidesulfovibrio sp.]|uniref:adenosylmethionine--8-amino-7-oxononanoate transaminase n=1 Tax=Humidesulfovibrio sp. TaxID=2910988 RepID=UPI0027F43048|nr:adenosylmethionine--8-amino-7-oxononanoate transaminase [Humidesulfovibrio sp.]MDQ7835938.1 adenosylmethionine--8-amino-7-oxononanoate transaminase [Humidesulfovibrio sp.]
MSDNKSIAGIVELDQRHVWHPFVQEQTAPPPLPVARAAGASLFLEDGREILDLASSWWVNVHGHCHPAIAQALGDQARTLEHVIFAGFTHAPAARLAEQLVNFLPAPLSRVFYSDNGSTAVEAALKMAFQSWRNQGERRRTLFLAFEGAYHGDTFGAMSVGRSSNFYAPFEDVLLKVRFTPFAETWLNADGDVDAGVETREAAALAELDAILERDGKRVAGFIAEPLVQGASGMRMCRPEFLRSVCERVAAQGIPVILDEVMTGFGRTGTLFAMEQAGVTPDLVCLSKGLTGGFLPLAATVASTKVYESFLGSDFGTAFAHGHSYTANPLGCAAALASLSLFTTEGTLERIGAIREANLRWLKAAARLPGICRPRALGSIVAVNLGLEADYHSSLGPKLKARFLELGLLVRPLGNVVYLMPPACITPEDLARAHQTVLQVLRESAPLYAPR